VDLVEQRLEVRAGARREDRYGQAHEPTESTG
jgi:hypothetical protein